MPTYLEPQAALETAVVNSIVAGGAPGGAAYPASQVKRTGDGAPYPDAGNVFVAVWSDNNRPNTGQKTRFEELFSVYVTISIRYTQPKDRWLSHRDDMEERANSIRALIGQDQLNFATINAANVLAGYRSSGDQVTVAPAGWVESLLWLGMDAIQQVQAEWFSAAPGSGQYKYVGIAQRLKWGQAKRVNAVASLSP